MQEKNELDLTRTQDGTCLLPGPKLLRHYSLFPAHWRARRTAERVYGVPWRQL